MYPMRSFFIGLSLLIFLGAASYAQELSADDLVERVRNVVDVDFRQEDQVKLIAQQYVSSFDKIYQEIKEGSTDKGALIKRLILLNEWFDLRLEGILNPDQLKKWKVREKEVYRDLLTIPQ